MLCSGHMLRDPFYHRSYSEGFRQVHAAFHTLEDRIQLSLLLFAVGTKRRPAAGTEGDLLSGFRAVLEFMKQPHAIADDYGKHYKGILMPQHLTLQLPEGIEEDTGRLSICGSNFELG